MRSTATLLFMILIAFLATGCELIESTTVVDSTGEVAVEPVEPVEVPVATTAPLVPAADDAAPEPPAPAPADDAADARGSRDAEPAAAEPTAEPTPVAFGSSGGSADGDAEPAEGEATDAGTEPVVESDTPEDPPAGDDPSCLVGTWRPDPEDFAYFYDTIAAEVSAEAGVSLSYELGGTPLMTLGGGVVTYVGDFSMEMTFDDGLSATATVTGSSSGTYTAADGVLTVVVDSSDLSMAVTVAGVTIDGSDLTNDVIQDLPGTTLYACDGPTLYWETSVPGNRVPVRLLPA